MEPNPRVGAVVVYGDRIIGEGWHEQFGGPHAEVHAISRVTDKALLRDSCLYISLEPCNHHGKTPPCTELILEMGIPHVVIGSLDPNPLMSGKSVAYLRARGVKVDVRDDSREFLQLNAHFEDNQIQKRPYIVLKWAESIDGFISGADEWGNPSPRAISSPATNRYFHWMRHELQAIWIAKNTAKTDNPSLTTRHWPGRDPLRVVMDLKLELPESLQVFHGKPTVVINALRDEIVGNVRFWKVENSYDLDQLLKRMYAELQIGSVLVEGGSNFTQQFLEAGLWDEVCRCVSPQILGAGVKAPRVPSALVPLHAERIGVDQIEWYRQALAPK